MYTENAVTTLFKSLHFNYSLNFYKRLLTHCVYGVINATGGCVYREYTCRRRVQRVCNYLHLHKSLLTRGYYHFKSAKHTHYLF